MESWLSVEFSTISQLSVKISVHFSALVSEERKAASEKERKKALYVSVSKRVLVQNFSYENEFDFHENEPVGGTNFHMNGFAEDSF